MRLSLPDSRGLWLLFLVHIKSTSFTLKSVQLILSLHDGSYTFRLLEPSW